MNSDTKKIAERVRKLMALAKNNSNEQEAMAALGKAQSIMAEHGITADDVNAADENWIKRGESYANPKSKNFIHHRSTKAAMAIAAMTGTRAWVSKDKVVFFGLDHEVEIAHYMLDLIKNVMDVEWTIFRKSDGFDSCQNTNTQRNSFMNAMVIRVVTRLEEMNNDRKDDLDNIPDEAIKIKGNELIIIKNRLIDKKLREMGIRLKSRSSRYFTNSKSAANAGNTAGGSVGFNSGVRSNSGNKLIN